MRLTTYLSALLIATAVVSVVDSRKTFSTRRKSGSNHRGSSSNYKHKQPPPQVTPQKVDSFLKAERAGSSVPSSGSSASTNVHHRGNLFNNKPDPPKQSVPHTNGPIGFEKLNQGNQKPLGFDKVNSDVQQKAPSSNIPSAPAYPGKSAPPNGPPPAYPGYGSSTGSHGGFEPPPAYPGRPVNAPPVYSANNPNLGQKPGFGGYPGQSYPGQSNVGGYPNTGGYGSYPNQGIGGYHNQGGFGQGGYGSYPSGGYGNWPSGGYGQSHQGFGGHSYGGSPFGQSNAYGGSPFGQSNPYGGSPFGGQPSFGGGGYGNPHYSPNNFGFSNNPGFFGSSSYPGNTGNYGNMMGYHKKSRFGGLPIPIPIPIPIPLGGFGFGGFGGHSHNHRVLDTFIKNQTVSTSGNDTTNVYILNNSTVTPCTTDQFIYDSLNVTVMSCTAGNCTAIKIFTTTYMSRESSVHSAGITMCLENNTTTFSSFADNINPTVSEVHKYWMRVCKEGLSTNTTGNLTEPAATNVTVKVDEIPIIETVKSEENATTQSVVSSDITTANPIAERLNSTETTPNNTTLFIPATLINSSSCEIFNCSWVELCLPSIELVDRCSTPDCPFTRTGYRPCVRIKMCKSPSTPISTFATLNNTISRIDQYNNVTSVNDVANLTLISYIPPTLPQNCSESVVDPACRPQLNIPPVVCNEKNAETNNGTSCGTSVMEPGLMNSTEVPGVLNSSAVESTSAVLPTTLTSFI